MIWYVLYVKPRMEKIVSDRLKDIGIEVYCPLIKEIKQWSDRKKEVHTPLFTSYVFVKLNAKNREVVFQVPGVLRYLFWLGKPAIVKDNEITTIRNWLSDEEIESVTVSQLSPGDRVQIKKGALKGQLATIQKIGKNDIRLVMDHLGVMVYAKKKHIV